MLGYLELLRVDVARQLDYLHAIDEGRRDRVQSVGRADEEDVGQVEGQVEVVVAEAEVLLRIEGLQQRARGIALVRDAHLVDLVDHEYRDRGSWLILRPCTILPGRAPT